MGGMQALQWGMSHPEFMDGLVALVPLARTPAWSVLIVEATRKAIMLDPAWNNGNYTRIPEGGVRVWRDVLAFASARSPEWYRDQFSCPPDVLPLLKAQEDAALNAFDPNDYIYQTWAYETHDVSATPGMNGDYPKALRSIKAKTLIMTGEPGVGAVRGGPSHLRRPNGHDQSGLSHRAHGGRRFPPRRRRADQRRGREVPRRGGAEGTLALRARRNRTAAGDDSRRPLLVEGKGFEPSTSALRTPRSPN